MTPDFDFFLEPTFEVFGFPISLIFTLFTMFLLFLYFHRKDKSLSLNTSLLCSLLILFSFARWHPQFILWIIPFMLCDAYVHNRRLLCNVFFVVVVTISLTWFGFYFSTWGHSFFFFSNYTPTLQNLSLTLLNLHSNEFYKILRLDILLQSLFVGVVLFYLYYILRQRVT